MSLVIEDLRCYFEGAQTGALVAAEMRPLATQTTVDPISRRATGECLKMSSISDRLEGYTKSTIALCARHKALTMLDSTVKKMCSALYTNEGQCAYFRREIGVSCGDWRIF